MKPGTAKRRAKRMLRRLCETREHQWKDGKPPTCEVCGIRRPA
jgi:hypothetical protein